ncbi:MAG: hypothetical protein ACLP59_15650 [Bryobacteraceae bacterium]
MSFWRRVFQLQKEKIAPWIALRNTLGFALPLVAGVALGHIPEALIAAIGALNVSYSDSHDPYVTRARRMLASSAIVGLAVFAGAICGNHHLLAVPIAGAWAFAAGMLVALSTAAADLGSISLVTLLVFAAKPLPPESAALSGLLALGGGLLQPRCRLPSGPFAATCPSAAHWPHCTPNWRAPWLPHPMCTRLLQLARKARRRRPRSSRWRAITRSKASATGCC